MSRFKNALQRSRKSSSNTVLNAVEKPFPKYPEEMVTKLEGMLEELYELHQRKYSTLTTNERRLVEMFCRRYAVNEDGSSAKDDLGAEYHVLKMSPYAHRFAVKVLNQWFSYPQIKELYIIEDERMKYETLYGSHAPSYNGDPFRCALTSYPDHYLPVRASEGKHEIFAVWQGSKAMKDLNSYVYKMRASVFPGGDPKFVTPWGIEKEEPAKPETRHETLQLFDYHQQEGEITPSIVAHVVLKREHPDLFIKLYGEDYEFSFEQHLLIKDFDQTNPAFLTELENLRSQL